MLGPARTSCSSPKSQAVNARTKQRENPVMNKGLRIKLLTTAALLGILLLLPGERREQLMAAASGCTRYDNKKPTVNGCTSSVWSSCYYCEYSTAGGYSVCYEDESGTTSYCTDYQDIPPFDF